MHVNTQKHHGHGVSMFAHVVGAICKSPLCCCVRFCLESLTLQFTYVEGRIAIRPYTCVFWTFANIHVTTQKNIMGMV